MPTPSDVERVLRVAVLAASDTAGSEMDEAAISCWERCPRCAAAKSPAVGS